ncbi:DUF4397 domain-containing protein [Arthrobacter sp. TMS1-12-1]
MTARPSGTTPPRHRAGPARAGLAPARRLAVLLVALVTGLVVTVVGAGRSEAADQAPAADGWARVAHLSPDTGSFDATLTAVAGGQAPIDLEDLAYGDVSDYLRLPAGAYAVDLTPGDSTDDAVTELNQLITVEEGRPLTLAVLGANEDLTAKVIRDDLTPPAEGQARVRVLQASTLTETVDIKTDSGTKTLTAGTKSREVTGYATVEAGLWDLQVFGGSLSSTEEVDLVAGTINTLLVLDNASGGLTVKAVADVGAVGDTPVGGTNTGAAPADAGARGSTPAGSGGPADPAASGPLLLLAAAAAIAALLGRRAPRGVLPARNRSGR